MLTPIIESFTKENVCVYESLEGTGWFVQFEYSQLSLSQGGKEGGEWRTHNSQDSRMTAGV